ncbi:MAG: hypothetical protein JXK05_03830 [Campylobacterales bacterium]|nr:hypothetical protein [Campylobacterales bacterium]
MKSLFLTGCLSAALLLISGCSIEEAAKDAAGVGESVVYAANGVANVGIDVTINDDTKYAAPRGQAVAFAIVSQDDKYTISYIKRSETAKRGAVSVSNKGIKVYAAAECGSKEYLLDSVGSEKFRVMNLTDTALSESNFRVTKDDVNVPLPTTIKACDITKAYSGSTVGV